MKNKQVMNRKTTSKELHLISCGYEQCLPDQFYGPGARSYYTIHFILNGQGHYFVADKHYTLHAKQCFLIPPDTIAFYKAEPYDPWTYVWICFHGNLVPSITAADAASHLHISRSYLFELFSQHLNMSPQAFLTSAKIMHARELLTATDISIANIAAASGYHNPFAFSRAFKKTTGTTPSEYRKKYCRTEKLLDC